MEQVRVRKAQKSDGDALLALIRALADYERLDPPDEEAQQRLLRDAFGAVPRFEAYLAEVDGRPVGYAVAFETYSTFLARPTLYLEDLFVLPQARRQGAGKALLQRLAETAREKGCGRMEWVVLDWNRLTRDVYQRIGAEELDDWITCRLTGEPLERLAGQ